MEKPKREPGDLAATGADDDAAPPPPAAGSPNDLGSVCAAPTSRSIAPLPSSEQHAADPESIQKTGAEADEPGTTDADDAIPSPALFAVPGGVVGLPIGSTSLSAAPASRATAPAPPSANGAAAFDAPDPDDARSLILEKFSRGRRGDLDLDLAVGSLATPRATEKPKSDPEDSAAPGADDAPPPPSTPTTPLRRLCTDSGSVRFAPTSSSATPPRPQEPHAPMAAVGSQFVDKTNGEADESAASTSRASAQPSEEPAVRGLAALGACASTPVLADDPSLLPGGITIDGKEVANSNITNGKPVPSTSMMLTRSEDGLKEGHPAAAVAKGKKVADQQWENCKSLNGQEPVVENEEEGSLQWLEHVANQTRLLEDKAEELKQVEEEQKEKKATLQHKEDALLLERLLLREKRMKLEEEEAARARRMHNRRLPRSNSHEGFMGGSGTGTAYHDDQIVQMHLGANAQLTRSLLQHAAPLGNPATSAVTRPPTATPKPQDDTWYKRQIGYVLSLEMAAGLVFLIRPLLPDGYDRVLLAGFAAIWGLGSIGLPVGIFGTSRLEKNCSRHIGRFVSLCFSLFTIYAMYLLAVLPIDARGGNGSTSHLSPPPSASDTGDNLVVWRLVFGAIGFAVFAGHISSWVMGCRTGGDRDLELLVTED